MNSTRHSNDGAEKLTLAIFKRSRIIDFRLEVIGIPVSDVDAAKAFYRDRLGFAVDRDIASRDGTRIVQLTPHGSSCSIVIGVGLPLGQPGSTKGVQLVVEDIDAARAALVAREVEISEVQQLGAEGKPGSRFAFFTDPDGNGWSLQEIKPSAASPDGNKAVIRRFIAAYAKHDMDAVWELFGPGCRFPVLSRFHIEPTFENYRAFMIAFLTALPDVHHTFEDMVAEQDKVWVNYTIRGTHEGPLRGTRATHKRIAYSVIAMYRLTDRKIVEADFQSDDLSLLRQLGALPTT